MAGTNEGFDAAAFRDGIGFAMTMGLPVVTADQPTFHFQETRTWPNGTALDDDGAPFNPSIVPTITAPTPVAVQCAVEFTAFSTPEDPVGSLRKTKVIITLLDNQYALVKDAIEVVIGGDTYITSYYEPPLGLFDVGIYRLVCFSKDEK